MFIVLIFGKFTAAVNFIFSPLIYTFFNKFHLLKKDILYIYIPTPPLISCGTFSRVQGLRVFQVEVIAPTLNNKKEEYSNTGLN